MIFKNVIFYLYFCFSYTCFFDFDIKDSLSFFTSDNKTERLVQNFLPDDFPIYPDKNGRFLDECQDNPIDITQFLSQLPIESAKCTAKHVEFDVQLKGLNMILLMRCLIKTKLINYEQEQWLRVDGLVGYTELSSVSENLDPKTLSWLVGTNLFYLSKDLDEQNSLRCSQIDKLRKFIFKQQLQIQLQDRNY